MRPNIPEPKPKVLNSDDDGALTIMKHNAHGGFLLHLVKVGVNTRVAGVDFQKGFSRLILESPTS